VADRDVVPGFLLLEDGTLFRGALRASLATTVAEVVFTTNMSGYQEVFTDPSYRAQIVVMTAPMIGNYGVNPADPESGAPQIAGVVVRELSRTYSNWRAEGDLESYLKAAQIPILEGVDTRKLTRHLRTVGVMRGVIAAGEQPTDEVRAALVGASVNLGRSILDQGAGRLDAYAAATATLFASPSRISFGRVLPLGPDTVLTRTLRSRSHDG